MGKPTIIVLISILSIFINLPQTNGKVARANFYSFGVAAGDTYVPPGDDGFVSVALEYGFPFFHNTYNSLFVNINGAISFGAGISTYTPNCSAGAFTMIAPFWADIDTTPTGYISYRQTRDRNILSQATVAINTLLNAYPLAISLEWGFLVTWDLVTFYGATGCNATNITNSFQAFITTDGFHSFAIFMYDDMAWTTGTESGGNCSGLGGIPAKVGFDTGNPGGIFSASYQLPISCTDEMVNIEDTAAGQWSDSTGFFAFRLDDIATVDPCAVAVNHLVIKPSLPSVLGHIPVQITGPCFDNATDIICTFYHPYDFPNNKVPGEISDASNNIVTCIAPYLDLYGKVNLILDFKRNGANKFYFDPYYPVEYVPDLTISVTGSPGSYQASLNWTASNLGDSSLPLDLVLVEFTNRWVEIGVVLSISNNPGVYTANPFNLPTINTSLTYVFRLTAGPVTLNANQTWSTYKPSLFSELQNFRSQAAADNIAACETWYQSNSGPPTDVLPCPPAAGYAFLDERFENIFPPEKFQGQHPGAQYAFRTRTPSPSGGGQLCTYVGNEDIRVGPTIGGNVEKVSPHSKNGYIGHFQADYAPWLMCCKYANDAPSCDKYYERRPSNSGRDYVHDVVATCKAGGDPHFYTLDGKYYFFNAAGEFWLLVSANFSVQVRMSQYAMANGTLAPASVFTAIVFQQKAMGIFNESTIQISVTVSGMVILIDGDYLDYPTDLPIIMDTGNGISINFESQTRIAIAFASGFAFTVETADENHSMNIIGQANIRLYGKITGLLGYFDGNQTNDFRAANGTTIPINSTPEVIDSSFGQTWRITESESFFTYVAPRNCSTYQDSSFVPNYATPESCSASTPQNVTDMCAGSFPCLYDYCTTGSVTLANDTKRNEVEYNQTNAKLSQAQTVKMCPDLSRPTNGFYRANNFYVDSVANFGCYGNYALVGHPQLTCVGSNPPAWNYPTPKCQLCAPLDLFCIIWQILCHNPVLVLLGAVCH